MTAPLENSLRGRRILLVIAGGIAAYKSLDLIRRLRERGGAVRVVMTRAAQEFITPLSAGAIAGERAYLDLFDARTEFDIGHIRLARDTDDAAHGVPGYLRTWATPRPGFRPR